MPDQFSIPAILSIVTAIAAISYAQPAAAPAAPSQVIITTSATTSDLHWGIKPEVANTDDSTYSADSVRPLGETAEVHGGVTCGPTSGSSMACGVAPVFGACPDGYDLIDYASVRADLPATCWRHEDVERDAGTGTITTARITAGTKWTFNRLASSTAASAQSGTLQASRPEPHHSKFAVLRRHPLIYALAIGAAVGATIAIMQRGSPCPGEYASGDPPCYPPPPDLDGHHRRTRR